MKKRILVVITAGLFVFGLVSVSLAKDITMSATLPTITTSMTTSVAKIDAATDVWLPGTGDIPIAFGTLTQDKVNNVFKAAYYFACDIGVTGNDGANWTISHTAGPGGTLNTNVNVTFMKQTSPTAATQLDKKVFGESTRTFTKEQLAGGWLRIYYGIATGKTDDPKPEKNDAPGALPIGLDKAPGDYTGTITITLI